MSARRYEIRVEEDGHVCQVEVVFWERIGAAMVGPRLLVSDTFLGFQDPDPGADAFLARLLGR